MIQLYRAFILLLFTFSSILFKAQEYDGILQFKGHNFFNSKELLNTKVKIVSGSSVVSEFNTNQSNNFKTELAYGKTYDIYFSNAKSQTMYIRVYADIPVKKRSYNITYELDIPFFPRDAKILDTTQFKKPFHQIVFDGKSRFVDDTTYMNNFLRSVYKKETPKDTTVPFITTEKIKEYAQLVGKLKMDNDKQSPIKNKPISVVNKSGKVMASSVTTDNGMFVFQNIDMNEADGLNVTLTDVDNPNKVPLRLLSSNSTSLSLSANSDDTYSFKNKENDNIIKKLVDKDYKFNVAGKMVAINGTDKKVAANKTVYLLSSKNNVIQKVKTNALGSFLFTKVVPGYQYSIAFDSIDSEPNYVMSLFSTKDKFIRKIDSLSNKRFVYKFLSFAGTSFNDLIIDDSELKMNVKGKLYGDNKNNPLSNIKVLLLNDKYETIDTAMTSKEGNFLFDHVPYAKQFLISADNNGSVLDAFNNILVFDNDDNLIKVVTLVRGQKFNYKPLLTEQSRISDIYIDDPWLALINKEVKKGETKNNATIIENILFEFNKSDLLPQSQQTLEKVVIAMLANKNFNVELSAHSDSKGSDAYNLKLSEQRANSAKNYIVSKGIEASRITAIGYGESKLLNNCGNGTTCSEDEHAVNRRLEFKLIFK